MKMSDIRVVGISGSPRVSGNTALFLKETLEAAKEEGAQVELVELAKKRIFMCDGCQMCVNRTYVESHFLAKGDEPPSLAAKTPGKCKFEDDMDDIIGKLKMADCIVIGTPVYHANATPLVLNFLVRLRAVPHDVLKNKVGAAVSTGRRVCLDFAIHTLWNFFWTREMILPGSRLMPFALTRHAIDTLSNDQEGIKAARELGIRVVWLARKLRSSTA